MKIPRVLPIIALAAFIAGLWTACTIGFDPSDPANKFSCTTNEDCIAPNICKGGVCTPQSSSADCVDEDDDGFGVGEVDDCPKCREQGLCDEDCNDNDASVAPDRSETCDGKDNNCNDDIDEESTCMTNIDCAEEQPYIPACEGGTCIYRVPLQQGAECTGSNAIVGCVGGNRDDRPDSCF